MCPLKKGDSIMIGAVKIRGMSKITWMETAKNNLKVFYLAEENS